MKIKQYFWYMFFKKGKDVKKIWICAVSGEGTVNEQTYEKGFLKFCAVDLLNAALQPSSPTEADSSQIKVLIENKQCYVIVNYTSQT